MSKDPTITLFAGRADGAGRAPTSWLGPEILVTLFWLLALSATLAYGATMSNLTLTGTVLLPLNISVAPTPEPGNLDLGITHPALKVADVTVVTNSPAGYQVTVRSGNLANGGCATPCFYSTTTTDNLGFTFYRDGVPIGFTEDTGTFVQTEAASGVGGEDYAANVSYDGAATLLGAATNYSETFTFTMSAN